MSENWNKILLIITGFEIIINKLNTNKLYNMDAFYPWELVEFISFFFILQEYFLSLSQKYSQQKIDKNKIIYGK